MVLAAGITSGVYRFVLLLHVLAAIVGLGGVTLNALYGAQAAKRRGVGATAISEANYAVSVGVAEKIIYSIPVFGILLVLLSDDAWSFGDTWVWLSLVLFGVALVISHSVLIPGHRQLNEALRALESVSATGPAATGAAGGPPPQVAQIEAITKRMAAVGPVLHVLLVVLLVLMIWKPGA